MQRGDELKQTVFIFILAATLVLYGCAGSSNPQATPPAEPAAVESAQPAADPSLEMTLDDLSKYNGKNGEKAYIAVDGVIYDVTEVPPWAGGIHQGKYQAGIDASDLITKSPHGKKVLEKLTVVGKIK